MKADDESDTLFLTDKSNTEFLFRYSLKEKTAPQSSKTVLLVTLVLIMIILICEIIFLNYGGKGKLEVSLNVTKMLRS